MSYIISLNLGTPSVGPFESEKAAGDHLRTNGWTPPEQDDVMWTKGPDRAYTSPLYPSLEEAIAAEMKP